MLGRRSAALLAPRALRCRAALFALGASRCGAGLRRRRAAPRPGQPLQGGCRRVAGRLRGFAASCAPVACRTGCCRPARPRPELRVRAGRPPISTVAEPRCCQAIRQAALDASPAGGSRGLLARAARVDSAAGSAAGGAVGARVRPPPRLQRPRARCPRRAALLRRGGGCRRARLRQSKHRVG